MTLEYNKKQNVFRLNNLFLSFLKIGIIGFGGGSALIPVVEQELVTRQKVLTEEEYLKHTVISNITPGALPVKLGATCGYQLHGPAGAIIGAYAVSLPGAFLTVLITALFGLMGGQTVQYFNRAAVGITAFIVFLLVAYILKICGSSAVNWLLCMTAFLLTGGKESRGIVEQMIGGTEGQLSVPLFDISTITLMIVSFFLIILYGYTRHKWEWCLGVAVALCYAFCSGKFGACLGLSPLGNVLLIGMVAELLLLAWCRRSRRPVKQELRFDAGIAVAGIMFFSVVVLLLVAALLSWRDGEVLSFLGGIGVSTVTSFGGGEAYVSVADGIFVQGGYVPADVFYTRLVPVANALPGPILVKLAAGIGYLFGEEHSFLSGILIAGAALAVASLMCCMIALIVQFLYDSIYESALIQNLKQFILPVICGMLISTALSMLYEAIKVTTECQIPGGVSLVVLCIGIVLLKFTHQKFHIPDLVLLIACALVSLIILSL